MEHVILLGLNAYLINKHTYRNLKYKVNETTAVVEHDQQGHQVNNLRRVPLESWKILPDKARLQEKETINGMSKFIIGKLDENSRKEYLEKLCKVYSEFSYEKTH